MPHALAFESEQLVTSTDVIFGRYRARGVVARTTGTFCHAMVQAEDSAHI
jgi:hypothetical protein